jgi:hypothetical protein
MRVTHLLLFIGLFTNTYAQNCSDLIHYRDNDLVATYDNLLKKYKLNQTYINDIKAIRKDLENLDNKNDWGAVAKTINITTDFLNSLWGSLLSKGLKKGKKTIDVLQKIENAVEKGKSSLDKVAEESLCKTLANEILDLIPVISSVKGVIEGVNDLDDYNKASGAINKEMAKLEKALAKAKKKLDSQELQFKALNNYKNSIDAFLSKHCD